MPMGTFYECWYRVETLKRAGRRIFVSVDAAFRPTSRTPKRVDKTGVFPVLSYAYPEGWFDRVRAASRVASDKAQKALDAMGLSVSVTVDPAFEEHANLSADTIESLTFFRLSVEVPHSVGQKKRAKEIHALFVDVAKDFSGVMSVTTFPRSDL